MIINYLSSNMLIRLAKGRMKGSKTSRCHMPRKLKYKRMLIGKRKKKKAKQRNKLDTISDLPWALDTKDLTAALPFLS